MAIDPDDRELRQYLLGVLPDEQCSVLEEEYFLREDTLDRVWAAEDELIDDYLVERLAPEERAQFDRHYLASHVHRQRVETARQLRVATMRRAIADEATSARTSSLPTMRASIVRSLFERPWWLKVAVAALLVVMAVGGTWLVRARRTMRGVVPTTSVAIPQQPPSRSDTPLPNPPHSSAVVLAISLSPAGVRGAADSPRVVIPPGTDRVVIHLESDALPHPFAAGRAVVHTVSGREVWRGPATAAIAARPPAFAQIELPADRFTSDDYIVTLFETPAGGREIEGFRYFLRIRSR